MKFCTSCGAQIEDTVAFCSSCGAPQAPVNTTPSNSPTQEETGIPADNRCPRCMADLQNGVCLACGWTAPIQQVQPVQQVQAPIPQAAPAPVVVNVGQQPQIVNGPPCPKCHSNNTISSEVKQKKLSGGKIAAGVMTGGLSLIKTGVSSKQKVTWICQTCGNSFTIKA